MIRIASIWTRFILATFLVIAAAVVQAAALEIHGFVMTVSDIDRAVAFYESALHFKRIDDRVIGSDRHARLTGVHDTGVRRATLQLGDERIELEQYLPPGLVERGVWIRPIKDVIYLMPSFTITPDELRTLTTAVASVLGKS